MKLYILSALLLLPLISHAEEEVYYDCVPDATGLFYVEGTEGNGMRFCDWAARNHTEDRCELDVVSWQCPITCKVPCIDTDGSGVMIGAAVATQNVEKDSIPERAIITVSVFGLVGLIGLVGYAVKRNKDRDDHLEEVQDDWGGSLGLEPRVFDEGIPNEVFSPAKQDSFNTQTVQQTRYVHEEYSPAKQDSFNSRAIDQTRSFNDVYSPAKEDSFNSQAIEQSRTFNEVYSQAKQESFNTQTLQKTGTCCDPC